MLRLSSRVRGSCLGLEAVRSPHPFPAAQSLHYIRARRGPLGPRLAHNPLARATRGRASFAN